MYPCYKKRENLAYNIVHFTLLSQPSSLIQLEPARNETKLKEIERICDAIAT